MDWSIMPVLLGDVSREEIINLSLSPIKFKNIQCSSGNQLSHPEESRQKLNWKKRTHPTTISTG
jgi:hypothetical protein